MSLTRAYNPADGDVVDRAAWLADVDNLLSQLLRGSDLHPRAAIGRRQISDRYTLVQGSKVNIIPHTPGSSAGAGVVLGAFSAGVTTTLLPPNGAPYVIPILPAIVSPGSQHWLVGIMSRIRWIETGSAGELPQLTVYKGSDVIGGGPQVHDTQERYYYLGSDPFAVGGPRPLIDIQNGEYVSVGIDCTAGAGTDARAQGWDVWPVYKVELSS
jgi:hypothetical protein